MHQKPLPEKKLQLSVFFFFSRWGLYVVLAVLKLTMRTSLASNSKRTACLCFLKAVIKGVHYHTWLKIISLVDRLILYVCVHEHHVSWCICGGQRITFRTRFSPLTVSIPGMELRLLDFAAGAFTREPFCRPLQRSPNRKDFLKPAFAFRTWKFSFVERLMRWRPMSPPISKRKGKQSGKSSDFDADLLLVFTCTRFIH